MRSRGCGAGSAAPEDADALLSDSRVVMEVDPTKKALGGDGTPGLGFLAGSTEGEEPARSLPASGRNMPQIAPIRLWNESYRETADKPRRTIGQPCFASSEARAVSIDGLKSGASIVAVAQTTSISTVK